MTNKKEDKKDHIMDTAEWVFAEYGFEGASTRLLASEAGVNMAMLNYYFGSKDGLLRAVLERRISNMRLTLEEVYQQSVSEWAKLEQMVDIYMNRVLSNSYFHKLLQRELSMAQRAEIADFISDNILKNVQVIAKVIEEGIANGNFNQVDPEMTIATILGTKYYIINSAHVSSKLLAADLQDQQQLEDVIKPRVKKHIISLLKAYLIKHDA